MKQKLDVVVLIPSLNPDNKLIKYIKELIKIGFKKIIIVNDGSDIKYNKYFNEVEKIKECILLKHDINYGKGRALKTGFDYYLKNFSDFNGIVTADSDGQHLPIDTLEVAHYLIKNKGLILGARNFNKKEVPFKSKYGNKITTFVFEKLYKFKINDTQTGLRGISNDFINQITNLEGDRFEYEINMLIKAVKSNIQITEVPIKTIYIENNKSSHFNPIKDAFKIYSLLFKARKK